jgi:hypothetical protein
MTRAAILLMLIASLGLAEGDLLRPCHCRDVGTRPCGDCPQTRSRQGGHSQPGVRALRPMHSCCCPEVDEHAAGGQPPKAPGFRICCSPRPPFALPDAVPGLAAASAMPTILEAPVALLPVDPEEAPSVAWGALAMPRDGPWRLAPEALAVFLT